MKYLNKIYAALLVSTLLLMPLSVIAADGKVIFVIGNVSVMNADGEKSRLKRGSEINSGDVILTTARGQAQIKMIDGTLLAVRPNSEFKISDYQYEQDVSTDKSVYNLVKGSFRSITGKMGKAKKSSYAVKTVVGTIGIRGTDFTARICESNCGDQGNGLYVGVMQGGVTLTNDSGALDVSPGEFGYMSDSGVEPEYLDTMPGDLLFAKSDTENAKELASNSENDGAQTDTGNSNSNESDQNPVLTELAPDFTPVIPLPDDDFPLPPPEDEPTPEEPIIADPGLLLPSTGIATYTIDSGTSNWSAGVAAGSLNLDNTKLTVDFANTEVTAEYNFINVVADDSPVFPETWTASNSNPMLLDQDGNFSGSLSGTGSSTMNSRDLSGSTSGSLIDTTPDIADAPATASTTYDVGDGTFSINGTAEFSVSTVQ